MDVTVRQRTGNDAVIVFRISLRFHQSHAAAGGATFEVGVFRALVIEDLDQFFAFERHLVRGSVSEIDHLLGMTDGPVPALVLMTGVGARRRVSEPQSLRHVVRQALNRAGKTTVPDAHELAIPAFCRRQPQLHIDERIGCRFENHLNAAMRWNHCRRLRRSCGRAAACTAASSTASATAAADWSSALGNEFRGRDRGLLQFDRLQILARRCGKCAEEQ